MRRAKRSELSVFLTIFLAGLMLACHEEPAGTVVAKVGGKRLTQQDLESRIPIQFVGKVTAQERRRMVEGWVEEELLYQETLRRKLDEDPAVSDRVSRAVRDLLIAELLEREFKRDTSVSEEDIQDYYEAHQEDFVREQPEVRVRHILVQNRSDRDRVWSRLRKGEAFDQVAREASIDASAEDGGDLGYFTEDQVDASFWAVCEKAPVGRRVREATKLGYHVFEVLDRREVGTVRGLVEVRGEIRQRILAERRRVRRRELLAELRNRTPWSIAPEVLRGDGTGGE